MAIINKASSNGSFYSASVVEVCGKQVYSSVSQNEAQAANAEALGMVLLAAGATAACYAGSQLVKGAKALWKKF